MQSCQSMMVCCFCFLEDSGLIAVLSRTRYVKDTAIDDIAGLPLLPGGQAFRSKKKKAASMVVRFLPETCYTEKHSALHKRKHSGKNIEQRANSSWRRVSFFPCCISDVSQKAVMVQAKDVVYKPLKGFYVAMLRGYILCWDRISFLARHFKIFFFHYVE